MSTLLIPLCAGAVHIEEWRTIVHNSVQKIGPNCVQRILAAGQACVCGGEGCYFIVHFCPTRLFIIFFLLLYLLGLTVFLQCI